MTTPTSLSLASAAAMVLVFFGCSPQEAPEADADAGELNVIRTIEGNDLPLEIPVVDGAMLGRAIYFGYLPETPDVATSYTVILWTDDPISAAWFYDGAFYERSASTRLYEGQEASQDRSLRELRVDKLGVWSSRYELPQGISVVVLIHGSLRPDPPPDERRPYAVYIAVAQARE